jgi:hypothetical protein
LIDSLKSLSKEGGDETTFTLYGVSLGEAKAVSIYYKVRRKRNEEVSVHAYGYHCDADYGPGWV